MFLYVPPLTEKEIAEIMRKMAMDKIIKYVNRVLPKLSPEDWIKCWYDFSIQSLQSVTYQKYFSETMDIRFVIEGNILKTIFPSENAENENVSTIDSSRYGTEEDLKKISKKYLKYLMIKYLERIL